MPDRLYVCLVILAFIGFMALVFMVMPAPRPPTNYAATPASQPAGR